jgi:phosphate transport system substrate-binding protein
LISLASGAPATQCIALVSPDAYANPPSSYPIVAISYLLANSANNGTDLNAMRNLMWAPFNTTIISRVGSIGPGTGASFVNAGFTQSQLSGCIN